MKIIFDNEEQIPKFLYNLLCPNDIFEDAPWVYDVRCPGASKENCRRCWSNYIEMEVTECKKRE